MQLKRYISQETLPSRTATSPVDFQDFSRQGRALDQLGDTVSATGLRLFQAGSDEREKQKRQELHRKTVEEDLEVQESLTSFKTLAAEVVERRRQEYSPGASEDDKSITDFARNTIAEIRDLRDMDAFSNMSDAARARFRSGALEHLDKLIPDLNKTRTEMLIVKNEARLGQSKATYEHQANLAGDPQGVLQAMDGYAQDLHASVRNGTLSVDKAVERANKFNGELAESWFNGLIGKDPEGLFRAMGAPTPEQSYLFGLLGGKDRTGFTQDHERRVLDGIERKRKDDERKLEEKQTGIENDLWNSIYNGSFEAVKASINAQMPELKKLKPERFKAIMKDVAEIRDAGGRGDEALMNKWKTEILHDSNALGSDEIFRMPGLNWTQKQELYAAKRTQTDFERAASRDPKHFSNDDNYKFYDKEIDDQLGIIKLSPFTNATALNLLSQAKIAYRTEYERLHQEKKGHVSQEEAKVLMQQIVKTTRQNLGFKAKVHGEVPRFTEATVLQAALDSGKITPREFADEYRKLKAWRELEQDGEGDASGGLAPKRDFNKRGKN